MHSTIDQIISSYDNIALFCHDNPDGDAIWSLLGLANLLKKMNKKVFCFTNPVPKTILSQIPKCKISLSNHFDYKKKYDLIIFVDCASYRRVSFTQGHEEYFDSKPILIIDHHIDDNSSPSHAIIYRDDTADSNCEWIFELTIATRRQYYDDIIASYFYMGIITDTGNFSYTDTSRSLYNAAQLIDLWAKKWLLTKQFFWTVSEKVYEFTHTIIARMERHEDVVYVSYTDKEIEENNLVWESFSEYLLGTLQQFAGISMIVLFKVREKENILNISLRSQNIYHTKKDKTIIWPWINVASIAQRLWGGGHYHAAGIKIIYNNTQDYQNIIKDIQNKIQEYIALQKTK